MEGLGFLYLRRSGLAGKNCWRDIRFYAPDFPEMVAVKI
jgi:hypothetical protein